jgi:acyl-coenzyme A synthetase/AMP-(fatty) acid ligase
VTSVFNHKLLSFFDSLGDRPCLIMLEEAYSYRALHDALQAPTAVAEPSTTLSWSALIHLVQAAIMNERFSFLQNEKNKTAEPGLWLQTTGTTGSPKWVHHPWQNWLEQYRWRDGGEKSILQVMAFDHIGGLHSIFSALSRGMTIVVPAAKDGESVRVALQQHRVFLLPTTPAHLALLLQTGCFDQPLPYLRLISYGAEALSPALKQSISALQPQIRWRETYGSTETGILSMQSGAAPGSWQPSFKYKVVDGELHTQNLKGDWLATGDFVEEMGPNRLRFLGRKASRVKVGGILVSPEQTAAWLRQQAGVWQAVVEVAPNPLLGQVLEARIWAAPDADWALLEQQLRSSFTPDFAKEARPVRYRFEEMKVNGRMKNEG